MEIEYKGANSITVKAGLTNVVVNPKLSHYNQKDLKVDGSIELVTNNDLAVEDAEKILIQGPGEYEVSDVSIKGLAAQSYMDEKGTHHSTIYRLDIAGFRMAILGHISDGLSEDQLEGLGVIDILIIPVGGNGFTLDAHSAANITRQIDPKIVIPTHYDDKKMKYEVPQDPIENFLKSIGSTSHETLDKLKLKVGSLLPEILTVIELKQT